MNKIEWKRDEWSDVYEGMGLEYPQEWHVIWYNAEVLTKQWGNVLLEVINKNVAKDWHVWKWYVYDNYIGNGLFSCKKWNVIPGKIEWCNQIMESTVSYRHPESAKRAVMREIYKKGF